MNTIRMELPDKVYQGVKSLVDEGWFRNEDNIILEALRRFLDFHFFIVIPGVARDLVFKIASLLIEFIRACNDIFKIPSACPLPKLPCIFMTLYTFFFSLNLCNHPRVELMAGLTVNTHILNMKFMFPCMNKIWMTIYTLIPVRPRLLMGLMTGVAIKLVFGIGRYINLYSSLNLLWRRCKVFYI